MQDLFRQQPISTTEHEKNDQRVMPCFTFYFYGLAFLTSLFSSVSLTGPLLLGFALLPRLNRNPNTESNQLATIVISFSARLIAGIVGLVKTGQLLSNNWGALQKSLVSIGHYPNASPWVVNSMLAAGVIISLVFVFENAVAMINGFLREWAAERKPSAQPSL